MITILHIEINRACSYRLWTYNAWVGAMAILDQGYLMHLYEKLLRTDDWFKDMVTSLFFGHPGPQLVEVH